MKELQIEIDDAATINIERRSKYKLTTPSYLYCQNQYSLDKLDKINKVFNKLSSVEIIDLEQPYTVSKHDNSGNSSEKLTHHTVGIKEFDIQLKGLTHFTMLPEIHPIQNSTISYNEIVPTFIKELYYEYSNNQTLLTNPQAIKAACLIMCKEQKGSRLIQDKLNNWSQKEVCIFFDQIVNHVKDLSVNLFGNYVIQKLIEILPNIRLKIINDSFIGEDSVVNISNNLFGCRVLQKLLDKYEGTEQLCEELISNLMQLTNDPYGNHVVQKLVTFKNYRGRVINVIEGICIRMALEKYGCRILQALLEFCEEDEFKPLGDILSNNVLTLIEDQYGNYIIQKILQLDRYMIKISEMIKQKFIQLSKNKFSSNVIEKIVKLSNKETVNEYYNICVESDNNNIPQIISLMCDSFGNYVVQSLYMVGDSDVKKSIQNLLCKYSSVVKNSPYIKHMIWKINSSSHSNKL